MRAFAALYPDPQALEEMNEIIQGLMQAPAPVRWEEPDKIHITVKFIAEIERDTMTHIIASLREEIGALKPMRFEIRRIDGFPTLRRPRIVWLGGGEMPDGMLPMHRAVEDACANAGIEREPKKFKPHFTVGRVKQYGNPQDLINLMEACSFQSFESVFNELRFMESTLSPHGAVHREIDRIPFQQ